MYLKDIIRGENVMKITITIKNEWSGKTYDISLDNQQNILAYNVI